jgi:hypothetical protein
MVQIDRIALADPALERRPQGATDLVIDGLTGWERTYTEASDSWELARVVATETTEYRYYLIGTFGVGADQETFATIVSSFQLR